MKRTTLSLILAASVAACSSSTAPDTRSGSLLPAGPVELSLRVGQELSVSGTVLRVLFVRVVQDSRCPIDAICVWQGNAAVELGLTMGTGPTVPHVVNSSIDPRAVTFGGFDVRLLEVTPAPTSEAPIDPDRYTVKVRIEG